MADNKEVFISYNQHNKNEAEYLYNLLEGNGISCWMAPRDIPAGSNWAQGIMKGIENCSLFVILISSTSLVSNEVAKEVDLANTFNKTILPLKIEDVVLSGPFAYHLSSRQWVDAFEGEKMQRFAHALENISVLIKKDAEDEDGGADDAIGYASQLVTKINATYASKLDKTNAMLGVSQVERETKIRITYPLQIGTMGAILVLEYDYEAHEIEIFADAATDGDQLKDHFSQFIKNRFLHLFPQLEIKHRGRRWNFVTLLPRTSLSTPMLHDDVSEVFFQVEKYAQRLAETVISALLDWGIYARQVSETIATIEQALKQTFQEKEGWEVYQPEEARLDSFQNAGKLILQKKLWSPEWNNYKGRGLLCFMLRADELLLKGLKVGILKYEGWHELGPYQDKILSKAKELFEDDIKSSDWFALECYLPPIWQDSGLSEGTFAWQDKLDEFRATVEIYFNKLAQLTDIVDEACRALPRIQKESDCANLLDEKTRWLQSGRYRFNRLRNIAKDLRTKLESEGIGVFYRIRNESNDDFNDLYLTIEVGNFDVAIAYRFNIDSFVTEIISVNPPDYEVEVTQRFFAKFIPDLPFASFEGAKEKWKNIDIEEWIDRCEAAIYEHLQAHVDALKILKQHLHDCESLADFYAQTLVEFLPPKDGWRITNRVTDNAEHGLEPQYGLVIDHESWHGNNILAGQEYAPIAIRIVPAKACFDDLWLAVRFAKQQDQNHSQMLGQIQGACDIAFLNVVASSSENKALSTQAAWRMPLSAELSHTGGSVFDGALPSNCNREKLTEKLHGLAHSIHLVKPVFTSIYSNFEKQKFKEGYENIAKKMKAALIKAFPEGDGWKYDDRMKLGRRYNRWVVFKSDWNGRSNRRLAPVVLSIEAFDENLENLYFGIAQRKNWLSKQQTELLHAPLNELTLTPNSRGHWAWQVRSDKAFRNTGGAKGKFIEGEQLDRFVEYHVNALKQLAELAGEALDDIMQSASYMKSDHEEGSASNMEKL